MERIKYLYRQLFRSARDASMSDCHPIPLDEKMGHQSLGLKYEFMKRLS
jgi:hypothetical protein